MTTVKQEPKTDSKAKASPLPRVTKDIQTDCPIFLRKAYHMIDTCDSKIACWGKDGETFVVKNTEVFEKVIIPQFFKHSKFSSFVRQLNFYGFRKIKYADTIKIDPKLEAETANFWRFRHEKFQRGKPELLVEIKRSNGQQKQQQVAAAAVAASHKQEDVGSLKTEVTTLKERIELMNKNIDALTTLVSKVSLTQEQNETEEHAEAGSKRKKLDPTADSQVLPDDIGSMQLDSDLAFNPATLFPQSVAKRETSNSSTSQVSDDAFVDGLFTAFENDVDMTLIDDESSTVQPVVPNTALADSNRPDPELMNKLSDALTLVPKDIQVMIVDRLITAITSSDALAKSIEAASATDSSSISNVVEHAGKLEQTTLPSQVSLPVAAAALAAMISSCSSNLKDKTHVQKSLPIIPIH